ncbi:MFS general substrate transporter [Teratosphaeria nubilosa]|uniref:MFS general substrate transporter n=1 Tax=Teratosphaeria nubilosa TaxID=161662 RepID=A0A6G1L689_9PEZI|nr:MFS general substrate transporter [Teratosphaeria nubilosa]
MGAKEYDAHAIEVEKLEEPSFKLDGDVQLIFNAHTQRLPAVSHDPNDPLAYPTWRRWTIMATLIWFSIFSLLSISGLGTITETLVKVYAGQATSADVQSLTTYPTMLMAVGSFVLLPLAFVIGRRPVFLIAVVICFITFITAGTSKNYNAHFISRIFTGLATGTTETLLPLIISDMTFLDQRSSYFGIYWALQNTINAAVLLILPYIVEGTTWRWYYFFFVIIMGVGLLFAIFFLPETRFPRSPMAISGKTIYTDDFGHTHILSNDEAIGRFGAVPSADEHEPMLKRTFLQEMAPYRGLTPNAWKIWVQAYIEIAKSLTSPAVVWVLLLSSICIGTSIGIVISYSIILEEQFNWSATSVGLFNAGIIPASLIGMVYSGWSGDKVNLWMAKRNNGVHRPEHHLVLLTVPVIACLVGLIAIAIPANEPYKYSVWGMIIGWAIFEFGFVGIVITTTSFAAEVVPKSPGAAMVIVIGGKNLVSFGASQGIIPMVARFGYLTSLMILFAIFAFIALLGIPVYFLNGKWRKMTAQSATGTTV